MAATFTVVVSNVGNARRGFDTPITATIDDGPPQQVSAAPPLDAGDSSQLLFNLHLAPGRQQIRVQIDESISIVAMEILASDVVLSPVAYQVVSDGTVEFTVKATNTGSVPTGPITVVADSKIVGTIRPLQDGEEGNLTFGVDLPAGTHTVTVNAAPDSREVDTLNNDAVFNVEVDYVALAIKALAQSSKGFTRSGGANVSIGFNVQNLGVAPSGDFTVAFSCKDDPDELCSGSTQVTSLLPGAEFQGTIDAVLPQGTVNIELYAGELEHDYRLGTENVVTVTVEVPIQPPVDLGFDVATEISGYYADGSAAVNVTATLVNHGSDPVTDLRDVLISCRQAGQVVPGCGTVLGLELDDGYGPTSSDAVFKIPTGEVSLVLDGGDVNGVEDVSVPKRITFIDRATWECFADGGWSSVFPRGNCGGRDSATIEKWQNDKSIKFWATGNDRYVEVLEDVLVEISSELNIVYEWVREETDADIVAHVGLTQEEARSAGFIECEGLWGCSGTTANSDGSIHSGYLVVFQNTDEPYSSLGKTSDVVEYSLMHHLVRVLAPLNYRAVPDSVMSIDLGLREPGLSPTDIDIIDLIRHELVEPGSTVDEIRDLVVFREELVDLPEPPVLANLELIRRARTTLHNSDTALYELTGNWAGGQCDTSRPQFGPAQVTFGSFSGNRSRNYRMVTAADEQWVHLVSADRDTKEYWDGSGRRWRAVDIEDEQELITSTAWNPEFADPLVILASMLWFGRESQISIVRSDDAERVMAIELSNGFANPVWATRNRLDIKNITIDVETYVIQSFEAEWEFTVRGLSCSQFRIEAELEQYGAELEIPDDIQRDSAILSPAR